MTARCHGCKAETLPVTLSFAEGAPVVLADPQPDDQGDLMVRRWRAGWNARRRPPSVPLLPGWTRHRTHVCPTPEEKP